MKAVWVFLATMVALSAYSTYSIAYRRKCRECWRPFAVFVGKRCRRCWRAS